MYTCRAPQPDPGNIWIFKTLCMTVRKINTFLKTKTFKSFVNRILSVITNIIKSSKLMHSQTYYFYKFYKFPQTFLLIEIHSKYTRSVSVQYTHLIFVCSFSYIIIEPQNTSPNYCVIFSKNLDNAQNLSFNTKIKHMYTVFLWGFLFFLILAPPVVLSWAALCRWSRCLESLGKVTLRRSRNTAMSTDRARRLWA